MIRVIKAESSHAPVIARLRHRIWCETYRGIYPDDMLDQYDFEEAASAFALRILDSAHQVWLYFDEDQCVGYFAVGPSNFGPYKDFDLCLNNLYLLKEFKGRGLGKQAFAIIRAYCMEHNIHKFFCGCNIHNHNAVAFYRHMGGIQGDEPSLHENKSEDIIHFEFYTGVEI